MQKSSEILNSDRGLRLLMQRKKSGIMHNEPAADEFAARDSDKNPVNIVATQRGADGIINMRCHYIEEYVTLTEILDALNDAILYLAEKGFITPDAVDEIQIQDEVMLNNAARQPIQLSSESTVGGLNGNIAIRVNKGMPLLLEALANYSLQRGNLASADEQRVAAIMDGVPVRAEEAEQLSAFRELFEQLFSDADERDEGRY